MDNVNSALKLNDLYDIINLYKNASITGEKVELIITPTEKDGKFTNDGRVITVRLAGGLSRDSDTFVFDDAKKFDEIILPRILNFYNNGDSTLDFEYVEPNVEGAMVKLSAVTADNNYIYIESFDQNIKDKILSSKVASIDGMDMVDKPIKPTSYDEWNEVLIYSRAKYKNKIVFDNYFTKEEKKQINSFIMKLSKLDDIRIDNRSLTAKKHNIELVKEILHSTETDIISHELSEKILNYNSYVEFLGEFVGLTKRMDKKISEKGYDKNEINSKLKFASDVLGKVGFFNLETLKENSYIGSKRELLTALDYKFHDDNNSKYEQYAQDLIGYLDYTVSKNYKKSKSDAFRRENSFVSDDYKALEESLRLCKEALLDGEKYELLVNRDNTGKVLVRISLMNGISKSSRFNFSFDNNDEIMAELKKSVEYLTFDDNVIYNIKSDFLGNATNKTLYRTKNGNEILIDKDIDDSINRISSTENKHWVMEPVEVPAVSNHLVMEPVELLENDTSQTLDSNNENDDFVEYLDTDTPLEVSPMPRREFEIKDEVDVDDPSIDEEDVRETYKAALEEATSRVKNTKKKEAELSYDEKAKLLEEQILSYVSEKEEKKEEPVLEEQKLAEDDLSSSVIGTEHDPRIEKIANKLDKLLEELEQLERGNKNSKNSKRYKEVVRAIKKCNKDLERLSGEKKGEKYKIKKDHKPRYTTSKGIRYYSNIFDAVGYNVKYVIDKVKFAVNFDERYDRICDAAHMYYSSVVDGKVKIYSKNTKDEYKPRDITEVSEIDFANLWSMISTLGLNGLYDLDSEESKKFFKEMDNYFIKSLDEDSLNKMTLKKTLIKSGCSNVDPIIELLLANPRHMNIIKSYYKDVNRISKIKNKPGYNNPIESDKEYLRYLKDFYSNILGENNNLQGYEKKVVNNIRFAYNIADNNATLDGPACLKIDFAYPNENFGTVEVTYGKDAEKTVLYKESFDRNVLSNKMFESLSDIFVSVNGLSSIADSDDESYILALGRDNNSLQVVNAKKEEIEIVKQNLQKSNEKLSVIRQGKGK